MTHAVSLDRRLAAFRPDLADAALRGQVEAARYVEGAPARIGVPVADLLSTPDKDAGMDTQLLLGDAVRVFERRDGWAWVQAARDSYVGYVAEAALATVEPPPTHVVAVPRSFVYRADDLKSPRRAALSLGSGVNVGAMSERRGTRYAALAGGGHMIAAHLRPAGGATHDYVAVAETLEHTPYLWGGASAFGIDCSGLVQLSMRMAGRDVVRDTDMQAARLGAPLEDDLGGLRRGDLVFWKGHVAIMLDGENIIHANGHTMSVAREALRHAVDRIAYLYGGPKGFRRP